MIVWIQLFGYFALVFAISAGAGYFLTTFKVRRTVERPDADATIQIRSGTSIYRARFVREEPFGWVIGAPLSRDSFVPVRVGEKLTVWAPTASGLRHFDTEVLDRDSSSHELTLAKPIKMCAVERRETPRIRDITQRDIRFEGQSARLIDISEHGARLYARCMVKKGKRVRVEIAERDAFGWILESRPEAGGCEVRLRFEEGLDLGSLMC